MALSKMMKVVMYLFISAPFKVLGSRHYMKVSEFALISSRVTKAQAL